MGKCISSKKLSDTLSLAECNDGFWLYDKIAGMNISMRAKTETDAFIEALTYYQRRCVDLKTSYQSLSSKVDVFIDSVTENE